jgi:hypothetical protein
MSVELWVTDETSLDLGQTTGVYSAFKQIVDAIDENDKKVDAFYGLLTVCEIGDACDPGWLSDVRKEAAHIRKRYGKNLDEDANNLLENLAVGEAS